MQSKIERVVIDRMLKCPDCKGTCYYTKPGRTERSRCKQCFEDDIFLLRYRTAKLKEEWVDPAKAKLVREKFKTKFTVFTENLNPHTQNSYAHSAAYFGAKYLYTTEIFSDIEIIDTVFHNTGVIEGTAQLSRFIEPKFAVFFLGKTRNKKFIGSHIMNILRQRETDYHFSFIVIPDAKSVKEAYEYPEIEQYFEGLREDGAVV